MTTRASTLARTARFVFALARTTTWSTGGTSGSTRASRCVQLSLPRPAPLPRPRTLLPSSGLGWEYESISRPHPSPFLGECTSFPTPRPRTLSLAARHTSHTSHWPLTSPLLAAGFKAYTALSPDEQGKHGWNCTVCSSCPSAVLLFGKAVAGAPQALLAVYSPKLHVGLL